MALLLEVRTSASGEKVIMLDTVAGGEGSAGRTGHVHPIYVYDETAGKST